MNDKAQVWFVKTQAQRRCCHQRFHPVVQQCLLEFRPVAATVASIRHCMYSVQCEPFGHLDCIPYRQGVDDAAARHGRYLCGQPCQAFSLAVQADGLKLERWPVQFPPRHIEVGAQYSLQVLDHSVVGGCRRRKQAHVGGQSLDGVLQQTVVRSEVMTPVRDAVGLVNHQQRYFRSDMCENLRAKALVGQPLWRDEQNVHLVVLYSNFDTAPGIGVVGVDRLGTHAHAFSGCYLVAHQCEQRRNEQDGSLIRLAQQSRGDEVDEALAPSGLLYDEITAGLFDDGADSLFLSLAELGVRNTGPDSQQFQRTFRRIRDHALSSLLESESP